MNEEIKVGDIVRITQTRFAVSASLYSQLFSETWQKYRNREGKVIDFADKSVQGVDDPSCVIQFEEGDTVAWAMHHVTKVETWRHN